MFAHNGHDVTVFIPDETTSDYAIVYDAGIRQVRFNTSRTKIQNHLGFAPALAYEFAKIVKDIIEIDGKPDVIESQEYLAIAYYVLQFKLLEYPEFSNIPVILTLHSPAFLYLHYNREGTYKFPNYWTGEMEKSCIRSADICISPSAYIIEEIKEHMSLDGLAIPVIHNPYRAPQERPEYASTNMKIVFFGKLSPQKGVFELFQYMEALWMAGFEHPIYVIGGSEKVYYPEMKTMGHLVQERYDKYIKNGLIKFVGKIAPAELNKYLQDAQVILVPSTNDNLPYTVIESMARGKVVLASRQGGQRELIADGRNGFLFDHNIPGEFQTKLKSILSLTTKELFCIGEAAQQTISSELNHQRIYQLKSAVVADLIAKPRGTTVFPFTREVTAENKIPMKGVSGLLSVVIPYYNMGKYIDACIESVKRSSYHAIEIIIVNDGSTNESDKKALNKFNDRSDIKIVHQTNRGLAETRNAGAQISSGEFVAFLDADDMIHPDYYAKSLRVLQKYENVFFVGSWIQYFGSTQNIWPTWNPEPPYILLHNTVNSSSLVYKKAAFLESGKFDKRVDYGIEDYESVVNMIANGHRGVVLPECLFLYRVRSDSIIAL